MLDAALGALSGYGPVVLALMLFVGGLGVPVPGAMLLLAAGASSRAGTPTSRAAAVEMVGVAPFRARPPG